MNVLRGSTEQKVEAAAVLANEILNTNSVLSVNDDMACVLPNKQLADWLVEMVEKSSLCNKLGIFIKSRKTLNSFSEAHHPRIGHIYLDPLDTKDRMKLFYSLLRIYNLTDISDDDVRWFVGKLLLSPSQLVKAVEALAQRPLAVVKRDIDTLVSWGDTQITPMLRQFFVNEDSKHILIILSRLDIVSYSILEGFFGERTMEAMREIDEMIDFGIVSVFGSHEQFFRLDHYLSDYIKRCHIQLPPDLESLLNDVLQNEIEKSSDITEDVSVYLYEKKRLIMSGKGSREDFLIPSVVVNSVMEVYNRQEYSQVISLCDEVLNDVHNYFPDQERELRYWLCSALARIAHKRFNDEVKYFKGVDEFFLRGFYHRNAKEYDKAERWLGKAIAQSPNLQRAKREMVTVLLAQEKFREALDLARDNYNSNPENSYQIHGYFRCLVKKSPLSSEDKAVLKRLMEEMKCNLSDKHEEMYAAMDIEYKDLVEHRSMAEMIAVIDEAEARFPNSDNVKQASKPFKQRNSIGN